MVNKLNRRFCVAPMLDWTDRHERYFLRLLSRHSLLYSEMITSWALQRGDRQHLLRFHADEHPVALQLGGSEPQDLAECARMGEDFGYDEINLNVGCPSERVQSARFGACLMAEPDLVGECLASMQQAVSVPVTVKSRIGIDNQDDYAGLFRFVDTLSRYGCTVFIVHARKAWLQGLSPKQNREVPPLHYDYVYRLKRDFPFLTFIINGGILTLDEAETHLQQVDGVMLGRAVYHNPYLLASVDQRLMGDNTRPIPSRHEILEAFLPYVEMELAKGTPLKQITRHILGLFQGEPGARQWRRLLSEQAHKPGQGIELLREAAACIAG